MRRGSPFALFGLALAGAGCGAPVAPATPPSLAAVAASSSSAPESPCAGFTLPPVAPPPPARPRMPGPSLALSFLAPREGGAAIATRGKPLRVVDLGLVHVAPRMPSPPRAAADVGRRRVPRPAFGALPPDVSAALDARDAAFEARKQAAVRLWAVRDSLAACGAHPCRMVECYTRALAEAEADIPRFGVQARAIEVQLIARLAPLVSGPADAGTLLLFGELKGNVAGEQPVYEDIITPLARARAGSDASTETGHWARYLLGLARIDAGAVADGVSILAEIANAPPRDDGGTADALYRMGDAAPGAAQAALLFHRAAEMARSHAPAGSPLLPIALYREMGSELDARHARASLDAGAALANLGLREMDFDAEIAVGIGAALRGLARAERAGLPSVPAELFAPIAVALADAALEELDRAGAERAWEAIAAHAPSSLDAPGALARRIEARQLAGDPAAVTQLRSELAAYGVSTPWAAALRASRSPSGHPTDAEIAGAFVRGPRAFPPLERTASAIRSELEERARMLVSRCYGAEPDMPDDFVLEVTASDGGAVSVRARARPGGRAMPKLFACVAGEGPRFFSGAPASLRARVAPAAP